jgi:hypothetical protein
MIDSIESVAANGKVGRQESRKTSVPMEHCNSSHSGEWHLVKAEATNLATGLGSRHSREGAAVRGKFSECEFPVPSPCRRGKVRIGDGGVRIIEQASVRDAPTLTLPLRQGEGVEATAVELPHEQSLDIVRFSAFNVQSKTCSPDRAVREGGNPVEFEPSLLLDPRLRGGDELK